MSHDRGCHCGREKWDYDSCPDPQCFKKLRKSGPSDMEVLESKHYPQIPPENQHDPVETFLEGVYDGMSKKVKEDGGGLRKDAGKNRLELIPATWTWALGDVLTKGAYKYEDRNWERGMPWDKMVGCYKRHVEKFMSGERYDEETGCHHLAMAAWNILALMDYDLRSAGENNLPHAPDVMPKYENAMELLLRVNSGDPSNPEIRKALKLDE